MALNLLLGVLLGCALSAAVVAISNWVLALKHRRPDLSVRELLERGLAGFDPVNFTQRGQKYLRRLGRASWVFFLALGVGTILTRLTSPGLPY